MPVHGATALEGLPGRPYPTRRFCHRAALRYRRLLLAQLVDQQSFSCPFRPFTAAQDLLCTWPSFPRGNTGPTSTVSHMHCTSTLVCLRMMGWDRMEPYTSNAAPVGGCNDAILSYGTCGQGLVDRVGDSACHRSHMGLHPEP